MRPTFCSYCKIKTILSGDPHYYWQKSNKALAGGYWKCKQQNRDNVRRWRRKNPERMRLRSHRDYDKKHSLEYDLSLDFYCTLIKEACFYCEAKPANGADRKDSRIGHVRTNCVPCCAKCNIILGDIPFKAKCALKPSLRDVHRRNLLKDWDVPSKRRKVQ